MLLLVLRLKENNKIKASFWKLFCFMKHIYFLLFIFSISGFSQQKVIKTVDDKTMEISVLSFGLDYVEIVNSDANQLEIELKDVNAKDYQIVVNQTNSLFKISFKREVLEGETKVFRKFITKRISKVNAVLKIPQNKKITIFGKHVDIYSKSYNGDLKIYVDKGDIQLNQIKQNTEVRLFGGNISGTVSKANINVTSNNGTVLINNKIYSRSIKAPTIFNKSNNELI